MNRSFPPRPTSRRCYTLVELIMVIGILALLTNLVAPALQSARHKAQSAGCASNLRQIGICFLACVADNNNQYPEIEPNPAQPIYPLTDNALSLLATLQPYGLTTNVLRCPADLPGAAGPGKSWFSVQTNSYYWRPYLDNENVASTDYYHRGQIIPVSSAKVCVATDWVAPHGGKANRLYGDGHVRFFTQGR
jgi:prepilin-type processing-associated H-X9-DG protein